MSAPSFSAPSKGNKLLSLSVPAKRPQLSISPIGSANSIKCSSNDSTLNDFGHPTIRAPPNRPQYDSEGINAADENMARVKELRKVISGLTLDDESGGKINAESDPSPPTSNGPSSASSMGPSSAVLMSRSSSSSTSISLRLQNIEEDDMKISPNDLRDLGKLGEGSAGDVHKVLHLKTGTVMARKTMTTSPNPDIHKQILRELAFNKECRAPFIVKYYGAFLEEQDSQIAICMEFCEGGSLDRIYKQIKRRHGRTGEKVLGKVAEAVLKGLVYLHDRKIIHRDIKPSNILVSKSGEIKICDFGVSGELTNSMANTFLGTSFYMAPERMRGLPYTWTSDTWSLGLTIHEVAMNRFPFPPEGEGPLGPIDLLHYIERMEPPELTDDAQNNIIYKKPIRDFLRLCLVKSSTDRPNPQDLLSHPWIVKSEQREVDLARWIRQVWGAYKFSRHLAAHRFSPDIRSNFQNQKVNKI